jgi:broad specificity phosphatase PhoE
MDEVVLARHGETETTARGVAGGDAPLTAAGYAQARALGQTLAPLPVDVCFTSPARRARETAELALAGRDVPLELLPELDDIDFGSFTGAPLAAYRAWISTHPPTEAPPGGESRVETLRRFTRAFRAILVRPERVVLVVAHGLALQAARDEQPKPEVSGVPYGSWLQLTRVEVAQAADRLEAWCAAPRW